MEICYWHIPWRYYKMPPYIFTLYFLFPICLPLTKSDHKLQVKSPHSLLPSWLPTYVLYINSKPFFFLTPSYSCHHNSRASFRVIVAAASAAAPGRRRWLLAPTCMDGWIQNMVCFLLYICRATSILWHSVFASLTLWW